MELNNVLVNYLGVNSREEVNTLVADLELSRKINYLREHTLLLEDVLDTKEQRMKRVLKMHEEEKQNLNEEEIAAYEKKVKKLQRQEDDCKSELWITKDLMKYYVAIDEWSCDHLDRRNVYDLKVAEERLRNTVSAFSNMFEKMDWDFDMYEDE